MEKDIKTLKFELNNKIEELKNINLDTFALNPTIQEIMFEIAELKEMITAAEAKEDKENESTNV